MSALIPHILSVWLRRYNEPNVSCCFAVICPQVRGGGYRVVDQVTKTVGAIGLTGTADNGGARLIQIMALGIGTNAIHLGRTFRIE